MPRRKHKKYTKPKTPFDSLRIEEENNLIKKYGLKNKREIWKTDSAVDKLRGQAKKLLTKSIEEQEKFVNKLQNQGFKVNNIADILSLNKEDYLKRRLQSIVVLKNLATTPKQARQFISHKNIAVDGKIMNIPSYIVPVDEEDKITLEVVKKIKKPGKLIVEEKQEEKKEDKVREEKENAEK